MQDMSTNEMIISAAREEFLQKGFQGASLRNIVKKAGVTTGAFYRYYPTKEALFAALVDEQAQFVLSLYHSTFEKFKSLDAEGQTEFMLSLSGECISRMMDYIYDNFEAFKLIITCSQGTPYEDFIHKLVEDEVETTLIYIESLKSMGYEFPPIKKELIHMIASALFSGCFETVVHDMPKEDAAEFVAQLMQYNTAGWERLFGIKFNEKQF